MTARAKWDDLVDQANSSLRVTGPGTNGASTTSMVPTTTGGLTIYRNIDLDETGISVKASAGQVYGYHFINSHATDARFVKFYNKATAAAVGTDVPVLTIRVPAVGSVSFSTDQGLAFATGISVGATTAVADADTGAPSANDVVVGIFYK